jgi:hypothetical protein
MKRKSGLLVAVLGGAALLTATWLIAPGIPSGAPDAASVALPQLTPEPDESVAFGIHRCKPTLRHPCRRGHRERTAG